MNVNKTTDLDSVFYYWPSKWYFNTDLKNDIFSSDLENIFTTDLENDIFVLTLIMFIFPLLTLVVIFLLPPFSTTDLESDIFEEGVLQNSL